jgi:hypothetical protein
MLRSFDEVPMIDLHHRIAIKAPVTEVFQALSTAEGLSWWCPKVERSEVGLLLSFDDCASVLRMKVESESPEQVRWICTGDLEDWRGTMLKWDLTELEGTTHVAFTHAGWAYLSPHCATTNTCWGQLLFALKKKLEA